MVRTAVVGAGRMGKIHARAYRDNPRAEVVAVCDIDHDRAKALAAQIGGRCYRTLPALLEAERPEVISVCTDAAHHLESVMLAIEAGAHVLCEKPMSGYSQNIETMIAAARRAGVLLGANFNHRFTPVARMAKESIERGEIGEICFVTMWLTIALAAEIDQYFHLRSLHGHSFDMMRYLAGEIAQVHGFMSKPTTRRFYSNCAVSLMFDGGAVGTLTGSYDMSNLHPMERVEVGGTKGRLVLENVTAGLTRYLHGTDAAETWIPVNYTRHEGRTEYDFNTTIEHRIDAFLNAVLDEVPDPAPAEDALAATKVIEATIESCETGCAVALQAGTAGPNRS